MDTMELALEVTQLLSTSPMEALKALRQAYPGEVRLSNEQVMGILSLEPCHMELSEVVAAYWAAPDTGLAHAALEETIYQILWTLGGDNALTPTFDKAVQDLAIPGLVALRLSTELAIQRGVRAPREDDDRGDPIVHARIIEYVPAGQEGK